MDHLTRQGLRRVNLTDEDAQLMKGKPARYNYSAGKETQCDEPQGFAVFNLSWTLYIQAA